MKSKMFNLYYLLLALLGSLGSINLQAQNGLQNVIIEKYYVSNAADSASAAGVLPAGSVTYRIYVDMLPGYNFQALYGVSNHPLRLQSSTSFFNDENYGSTSPNGISTTNIRKFTAMIDSWFSVGAACAGRVGARKVADTDGTLGNANGILLNNDPSIGFPINGTGGRDGIAVGTPLGVTFVGINNTGNGDLGVFDGTSQVGGLFTTTNGSVAALGGATGLDTTNIVLVGQFTTNGIFQYELNVQIGTPTGGTQNFVASNPVGTEILASFLTGTLGAPNQSPVVSITAPANGASFITGSSVSITANASDADGTVSQVEFFVDGVSVGVDNTAPYSATYTAVAGSHVITARATDDQGAQTTSTAVNITVAANPPPTCALTAPSSGASFVAGDLVSISATATDNGFVTQVEFFVDGILLSTDLTAPYSASYTAALGSHTITARATDNAGLTTTSSAASITVVNNIPPTVSITSPVNGANFTFPATVTLSASASDADGSISSVGFYVNGSLVGTDNTAPYSFAWTAAIGTASITAVATDNRSAATTSAAVSVNVLDPNALPYKVGAIGSPCRDTSFCIPVNAVDTVNNVIGYDMVLNYNTAKVRPTGVVTVFGDLITTSYVDVANVIDTVNGTMNISLYFNSTAPANAKFAGSGRLVCVEFVKRSSFSFVDTATVTLPFLQESYFNGVASKLVESGRYTSFKDSLFNGSLKFWADNSPIRYNAANPNQFLQTSIFGNNATCNGQTTYNVSPDTLGNFSFVITNGSKLTINKNILGTTSVQPVVNGFDAFLLRRMLLSDPTFVPNVFQAIAMDVNLDGVISAGDLSQVNQRAVLFIPEFRQAWNYNASGVSNGQPSKDWIFVDSSTTLTGAAYQISTTFPNDNGVGFSKSRVPVVPFCLPINVSNLATCPDIRPDAFRAIMSGDVNGSYSVTNPNNQFRLSGDSRVIVDATKVKRSGNYLEVPVSFTGTADVHAIDLAIGYGASSLRYMDASAQTNSVQSLAHYNSDDATLRYTSSSLESLAPLVACAVLRFEVLDAHFSIDEIDFREAYLNGDRVRIERIGGNTFNMMVYPNPANATLNVVASEVSSLELVDLAGNRVFFQSGIAAGQKTEIDLTNVASGIYLVKASGDSFVEIRKVVVNR